MDVARSYCARAATHFPALVDLLTRHRPGRRGTCHWHVAIRIDWIEESLPAADDDDESIVSSVPTGGSAFEGPAPARRWQNNARVEETAMAFGMLLKEDEALRASLPTPTADVPGSAGEGRRESLEDKTDRLLQSLHARLAKKRAVNKCREKCEVFVALPTATATLRRPWKVNIRTSG